RPDSPTVVESESPRSHRVPKTVAANRPNLDVRRQTGLISARAALARPKLEARTVGRRDRRTGLQVSSGPRSGVLLGPRARRPAGVLGGPELALESRPRLPRRLLADSGQGLQCARGLLARPGHPRIRGASLRNRTAP